MYRARDQASDDRISIGMRRNPGSVRFAPVVASSAPCPARHRQYPARGPGWRAARPAGRNAALHRQCPGAHEGWGCRRRHHVEEVRSARSPTSPAPHRAAHRDQPAERAGARMREHHRRADALQQRHQIIPVARVHHVLSVIDVSCEAKTGRRWGRPDCRSPATERAAWPAAKGCTSPVQ